MQYTAKCTITLYVSYPKEALKGNFTTSQGDCSDRVLSDQMVLRTVRWEAGSRKRQPLALKHKLTQKGPSGSSPLWSDGFRDGQAGGCTSWEAAKGAQGRVGKQLYKSKGPSQKTGIVTAKMKMMMRTSMLQDRVTATLNTEELYLCTLYISLPHIWQVKHDGGGGKDTDSQHNIVQASWASHLSALTLYLWSNPLTFNGQQIVGLCKSLTVTFLKVSNG